MTEPKGGAEFDLAGIQRAVEAIRSAVDARAEQDSRGRIRRAADPELRPAVEPPTLRIRDAGEAGRDLSLTLLIPPQLGGFLRREG